MAFKPPETLPQTYRVDVSFDQIVFLGFQHQIISSEGDDPRLPAASRDLRQAVRVQASTGQDVTTLHLVALLTRHKQQMHTVQMRRCFYVRFISVLPFCL